MKPTMERRPLETRVSCELNAFDDLLRELAFDLLGSGQHKITMDELLLQDDALLLDVRSKEKVQTLALPFSHDVTTLHIPTNDILKADNPATRNSEAPGVNAGICLKQTP